MKGHGDPDITEDRVREIAREMAAKNQDPMDPIFSHWQGAAAGTPVLVSSIQKKPSYWIVPLTRSRDIIGFVRIGRTGTIIHAGTLPAESAQERGRLITGISKDEAERRALSRIDARTETVSPALFIHDGPVGRETWFVEVFRNKTPTRWLFINDAGIYERPAGSVRTEDLE